MAYRISATTEMDTVLLQQIRDLAWKTRVDVSEVIREAFKTKLYGGKSNWPSDDDLRNWNLTGKEG